MDVGKFFKQVKGQKIRAINCEPWWKIEGTYFIPKTMDHGYMYGTLYKNGKLYKETDQRIFLSYLDETAFQYWEIIDDSILDNRYII